VRRSGATEGVTGSKGGGIFPSIRGGTERNAAETVPRGGGGALREASPSPAWKMRSGRKGRSLNNKKREGGEERSTWIAVHASWEELGEEYDLHFFNEGAFSEFVEKRSEE